MNRLLAVITLCFVAVTYARDLAPIEKQKIEYLIAAIETLPNAQFVRNGTSYGAKSAADHLRLKLHNAGSRVKTADDFIRYCASVSSMSGQPYEIRFSDGRVVTSEAFLRARLVEFQSRQGGAAIRAYGRDSGARVP